MDLIFARPKSRRKFQFWTGSKFQNLSIGLTLLAIIFIFVASPGLAFAGSQTDSQSAVTLSAKEPKQLPDCEKGSTNPDGSKRNYQDYALCMAAEIDHAISAYQDKNYEGALDHIGKAYFGWYENALEPPSMTLQGSRKIKMEGRFTRVKLAIKTNPDDPGIVKKLQTIKVAVARDAMVLDGVIPGDSPESAGNKLLTEAHAEKASSATRNWVDFFTAMTLLLREGLEALLVVVAIVLYLVKSGNKHLVKSVYWGVAAAVALSFVLAWLMSLIVGGAGQASELLEGLTMFLAVGMLFYVSNWMLSKTSGENWSKYIKGMVKTSVSSGAAKALVFAAFLAVIREGAELVLFYTAAFSGESSNPLWIGLGFAAGVGVLALIFLIFRYGGAKLPVRPIFMGTSILLFIMCISFVGKGVQELKEANVILGSTDLPWVTYYLPELGIYPQAETLLPQLILLIASVWIILAHTVGAKRKAKVKDAELAAQSAEAKA